MEQKPKYDYSSFGLTDTLPVSGMTVGMAITTFRQAKERRLQLRALAEQECCSEEDIKKLLLANGVSYKEFPRAPRKKAPAETDTPDPTPSPAQRPAKISTASPPPPEKDQTIKADAGKPELRLVPWQIVRDIAQIRTYGNRKYHDPDSWRRVELDRYIDALLRHVIAFAEDPAGKDAESGIEHYKHAACNLAFIAELMKGENNG